MGNLKVALFGLTGFGNNALKAILGNEKYEPTALFTNSKPKAPFPYYECDQIHDEAAMASVPVIENADLQDEKITDFLVESGVDIILVASYNRIIPKEIISIPKYGVINFHPSLLPKYRGATPVSWALLNGESVTGVTAHFIEDENLDSGRIILSREIPITLDDNNGTLRKKLGLVIENILDEAVELVMTNDISSFARQDNRQATYSPNINNENCNIDINQPSDKVINTIRALTPYPGARIRSCNQDFIVRMAQDSNYNTKSMEDMIVVTSSGSIALKASTVE